VDAFRKRQSNQTIIIFFSFENCAGTSAGSEYFVLQVEMFRYQTIKHIAAELHQSGGYWQFLLLFRQFIYDKLVLKLVLYEVRALLQM